MGEYRAFIGDRFLTGERLVGERSCAAGRALVACGVRSVWALLPLAGDPIGPVSECELDWECVRPCDESEGVDGYATGKGMGVVEVGEELFWRIRPVVNYTSVSPTDIPAAPRAIRRTLSFSSTPILAVRLP